MSRIPIFASADDISWRLQTMTDAEFRSLVEWENAGNPANTWPGWVTP